MGFYSVFKGLNDRLMHIILQMFFNHKRASTPILFKFALEHAIMEAQNMRKVSE